MRDAINRRFPEARASLSSEFAENTEDMANADAMFTAIGFLALLVGGIVVANTLLMSVHERTREIGTLRALGWAKGRILSQIMRRRASCYASCRPSLARSWGCWCWFLLPGRQDSTGLFRPVGMRRSSSKPLS